MSKLLLLVRLFVADLFSYTQMGFCWRSWIAFFAQMVILFIQHHLLTEKIKIFLSFGISWWTWLQKCVGDSLLVKFRLQYGLKKIINPPAFCRKQNKSLSMSVMWMMSLNLHGIFHLRTVYKSEILMRNLTSYPQVTSAFQCSLKSWTR